MHLKIQRMLYEIALLLGASSDFDPTIIHVHGSYIEAREFGEVSDRGDVASTGSTLSALR
ncbi:hypothetical protein I3J27_35170 [Bradyrhizobium xenonodulans]|uniref:Uncharacterized protein n=1 Tax=Bradyrhizobium xenonodulans TaxID=2736875 RepID=A0ABY7MMI0_9BRAD|nr:hypothetical protein [Bradyrhizobium xenonodulans]WBL78130.1 hypothetical protein I3J27_35170 [Bradyrhizobium xenonodulans]